MNLTDKTTLQKIRKGAGILLLMCGGFGFFYVMYGGSATPKDVMITIFFFAFGLFTLIIKPVNPK